MLHDLRPAAVIFDMDGLLLDSERVCRDLLKQVCAAMGPEPGYAMSDDLFASLIGVPEDGNRRQLAAVYGPDFDYDAMNAGYHARREADFAGGVPLKAGALAAVAAARALGLPTAVATSTLRRHAEPALAQAGIAPLLNALVPRDDAPRGKPFPDLYLEAARRIGVAPGDCLALEDSYNGVRAAHAAGVPVIMVPDLLAPTDEMRALAIAVMPDLFAVIDWLQRP